MGEPTATTATATKRVLIVEEEPGVLSMLRDVFALFRHGHTYEITTAECVADAFTLLRQDRFDLILFDVIILAGGYWVVERNLDRLGANAPVLMMIGGHEPEALKHRAAGFIYKPFSIDELDEVVARVLGSGA